jgi:hypothetical protein
MFGIRNSLEIVFGAAAGFLLQFARSRFSVTPN